MAAPVPAVAERFAHSRYLIRRKVLKLFGKVMHVYDPHGRLVFYSRMKGFRLKEDIRLYTHEDMRNEALVIRTRQILDFSAAYDVITPMAAAGEQGNTGEAPLHGEVTQAVRRVDGGPSVPEAGRKLGSLKRKGWRSLLKDKWIFMDADGREIGILEEDRTSLAVARRVLNLIPAGIGMITGVGDLPFWPNLIPQGYTARVGGSVVFTCRQNFNPIVAKIALVFAPDAESDGFDKRLGIAAAVLLCAIEGRQG